MMKNSLITSTSQVANSVMKAGKKCIRKFSPGNLRAVLSLFLTLTMAWNSVTMPFTNALGSGKSPRRSSSASKTGAAKNALQGGQTMVVWGPQQVVRQPINTTYTAQFPLPNGAIAPYQMTVSNGAPNGTNKVTQACIKLNGVNILSTNCYHSVNPTPQIRTVSLQANNTVEVSLVGPVLSYITITVTANQASLAVSPGSGTQGQTLTATLTGTNTNWISGQTTVSFGGEVTVNSVTVATPTSATAQISISSTAALGPRTVTVTTGSEVVSAVDAFTVNAVTPPGPASSTVSTLAGSAGNPGFTDGTGAGARFRNLAGIAAAPNEVVYVADAGNHSIRRVDGSGAVTTIAGSGSPGFFDDQGTFAEFNNPQGVAVDGSGNVYVADTGNHSIRKIDTSGNVTTLAGDGTAGLTNGTGAAARFNSPKGIAVDNQGKVYVADTGNHAVRKIETNGAVTTLAGDGTTGSADSPNARFNGLAGMAVDGQTIYVYLADTNNHRIRRLEANGVNNPVITLAGQDRGFKDGTAAESRFADPVGIAADGAGHLVIAETTNSLVREVDPARALNAQPNAVYTLAGTGERGSTDGAGNVAKFNKPGGVAVLTSSAVIIADTGNQTLRKLLLPPVVASLNPANGIVGTAVAITGNRFDERGTSFNTVRFAASGGGTVTATVTSATRSQINVTVPTGAVTGNVTVQTAGGTSNGVTFTIATTQPPVIADFNPKTGTVGTVVTLTGTNLKVGATDPVVSFQGPNSTRLTAAISSATATQVVAIVPNGVVTGLIDLTTSLGTATTASAFIVQTSQDYSLVLSPSSQTTTQGAQAVYIVRATSPQSDFTQLIKLSISGLPGGMTASFDPVQITAGGHSTLTLTVPNNLSPTSYSFTVQGLANLDGNSVTRTVGGSLTVMNRNGQTTLSGRVLGTDDTPIEGAHVFIGSATGTTNAAGAFLLTNVPANPPGGQSIITIDATGISGLPPETYPIINEPADVLAGQANVSSYIFYLPKIDWGNSGAVNNLDTTSAPAVVTNSNVPGLTMTIPQGVQLIGRNGLPITRASITPVPIDRVPAPLPAEITLVPGQPPLKISTPLVYTSQPGSATVANGAKVPVIYPNLGGASPGTVVPLFNFDHTDVTWKKYGDGQVSADGKTINPINGAGLPDFSWHFPFIGVGADPNDPDCGNHVQTPVDLSTGHKLEIMTDIAFGGARGGISLARIFTNDLSNPSSPVNTRFGHGMSDNFNIRLFGNYADGAVRVMLPDQVEGRLFTFDSAQGSTRVFKTTATISQLGDVVRWQQGSTQPEYRTKAGTVLRFEPQPGAPQNYRLATVTDRNGNATILTYTGNDLTSIKDAVNRELHLTYISLQDGLGGQMRRYVDTVTDPLNRVTRYYYEYKSDTARWLLRSVVDPMGLSISYAYNRFNWISSVKDARGNFAKRIEYYYVEDGVDPRNNGRVRWQIFADGRKETYQYSFAGQVVTGVKIRSYPNSLPDSTPDDNPQVRVMTRRFNARGYMIAATDALGQPSVIERKVEDNLPISTVGACGCPESSRSFDAKGNVLTMTNQVGSIVGFEYDPNFNGVSKVTLPDAGDGLTRVSEFNYSAANGNLLSIKNALNDITTFGYDAAASSLLRTITTPAAGAQPASTTTLNYDAYGFLLERLDPLNHKVSFEYDIVGRLKKATAYYGNGPNDYYFTEFSYDDSDRLLSVKTPDTDPATGAFRQTTTTYSYDANGNRIGVMDAFGKKWVLGYDAKNRLQTMSDPLSRTTRWVYNTEDELVKVITPSGRTMGYEYDKRGLQTKMTDGLGNTVNFSYDYYGDLVTVQDQRGNTTTFTYDKAHRPLTRRDPLGRIATVEYDAIGNVRVGTDRLGRRVTIDYDRLNRPSTVRYNGATVGYNYDAKGRWTGVNDESGAINWEYDLANRLTKETTPQGAVQYDYLDDNQRKTLTVNGQIQSEYEYDKAGRLGKVKKGAEHFVFAYDALSRRTRLDRPNGVATTYEYDDIYRLKRLQHLGGAVPEDLQYEYTLDDEIAKITSAYGSTQLPPTKTIGTADAANRIANYNGSSQVFDNEGQPASSGAQSYTWDARGRLTQATASGQTVGYSYDALGRRISRTNSSGTTNFQYDGADVVMDRQGAATVDYVNGPGIDEKLRQGGAGGTLYFQQDHLGSVIGLTGAVSERPQYEAFGRNGSASATRYGYTGRERDAQTSLLYYRARWYDAQQGRFLSEDPVGFEGGFNLYGYVDNSPLNYYDPYGYNPLLAGAAVGALAGALIGGGFAAARGGSWGDIGRGAAEGAVGGAVAGATLGLGGGAIAGLAGGGYPGAMLAGAVGGAIGDLASQMFGMAMGWRCKFDWDQFAKAAALGAILGAAGRALNRGNHCFVAGTKVQTAGGEKNIEEIRVGDKVLSSDPEQGENGGGVSLQKVVQVFERTATEVVDIRVGEETITATPEHPFWVVGRGWIAAGQLERGSPLMTKDGKILRVYSVTGREGTFKVYNLEVIDYHTYYVAVQGVLVHNACKLPRYQGPKPRYTENDAHVPGRPGFNPRKTPLPDDAAEVYGRAVPDDPINPRNWYGRNNDGKIYRFSGDNAGGAHFSGIDGVGDGIRNITPYARGRLAEN